MKKRTINSIHAVAGLMRAMASVGFAVGFILAGIAMVVHGPALAAALALLDAKVPVAMLDKN